MTKVFQLFSRSKLAVFLRSSDSVSAQLKRSKTIVYETLVKYLFFLCFIMCEPRKHLTVKRPDLKYMIEFFKYETVWQVLVCLLFRKNILTIGLLNLSVNLTPIGISNDFQVLCLISVFWVVIFDHVGF